MKKLKNTVKIIFALLLSAVVLTGCDGGIERGFTGNGDMIMAGVRSPKTSFDLSKEDIVMEFFFGHTRDAEDDYRLPELQDQDVHGRFVGFETLYFALYFCRLNGDNRLERWVGIDLDDYREISDDYYFVKAIPREEFETEDYYIKRNDGFLFFYDTYTYSHSEQLTIPKELVTTPVNNPVMLFIVAEVLFNEESGQYRVARQSDNNSVRLLYIYDANTNIVGFSG